MDSKLSDKQILAQYEQEATQIINEMMAIIDKAESKISQKQYQKTLEKIDG